MSTITTLVQTITIYSLDYYSDVFPSSYSCFPTCPLQSILYTAATVIFGKQKSDDVIILHSQFQTFLKPLIALRIKIKLFIVTYRALDALAPANLSAPPPDVSHHYVYFYSPLHSYCLSWSLAQSKFSVNSTWMNENIFFTIYALTIFVNLLVMLEWKVRPAFLKAEKNVEKNKFNNFYTGRRQVQISGSWYL